MGPTRRVAAGERQLEVQLVQPVGARDVAQPHAVDERPERRLDRGPQPGDDRRPVAEVHRPARQRPATCSRQLGVEVGRREVGRLEDRVHERAERGAARAFAEQQRQRRARAGSTGAAASGSSSTTRSSGSLATRASCDSAVMSL